MLAGSVVALVTPFRDDRIDREAVARLVNEQVAAGTAALVVCGTTGETPALQEGEREELVALVLECAAGRVPVIAGTGSNDTRTAIRLTQAAAAAGVDGVMVVTPYYNRPGQRGLHRHFLAVADASRVPVMLYDVPSRTGTHLSPATAIELLQHPQIQALKDAAGSPAGTAAMIEGGVPVLCGDDALTLPWIALGARGVVSVAANVAPAEVACLVKQALAGDLESARKVHYRLLPLFRALFLETNPAPTKALLALLGRCNAQVRLPLVEVEEATQRALQEAWEKLQSAAPLAAAGAG